VHPKFGRHSTHYSPIHNINPPMHQDILRTPKTQNISLIHQAAIPDQIAHLYQTVAQQSARISL
jgi:hypothetical protein